MPAMVRGCISMGAVGAMAPTNFERVAFGTHEILHFFNTCKLAAYGGLYLPFGYGSGIDNEVLILFAL